MQSLIGSLFYYPFAMLLFTMYILYGLSQDIAQIQYRLQQALIRIHHKTLLRTKHGLLCFRLT